MTDQNTKDVVDEIAEQMVSRASECESGAFKLPLEIARYIASDLLDFLARRSPSRDEMKRKLTNFYDACYRFDSGRCLDRNVHEAIESSILADFALAPAPERAALSKIAAVAIERNAKSDSATEQLYFREIFYIAKPFLDVDGEAA